PEHLIAVREKLRGTKPGRPTREKVREYDRESASTDPVRSHARTLSHSHADATSPPHHPIQPWNDDRGRNLYPLPFPELRLDPGVFEPTEGSFLVWKYLFRTGLGQGKKCLDIGCGSGILSIQLALNGAQSVHAIDIQREAAANTLANAFRNGVDK